MADDDLPPPGAPPKPLMPLHCVNREGIVRMVRRTGRPRRVRSAPDTYALEYAAENDRRRQTFISEEAMRLESEPTGTDRVWACLRMLAAEAAALKSERRRLEREDLEGGPQVSSRIVETYARMASLVVELRRFGGDERIDLKDTRVQLIIRAFLRQFRETAEETLGALAEPFLARFNEYIAGWESWSTG